MVLLVRHFSKSQRPPSPLPIVGFFRPRDQRKLWANSWGCPRRRWPSSRYLPYQPGLHQRLEFVLRLSGSRRHSGPGLMHNSVSALSLASLLLGPQRALMLPAVHPAAVESTCAPCPCPLESFCGRNLLASFPSPIGANPRFWRRRLPDGSQAPSPGLTWHGLRRSRLGGDFIKHARHGPVMTSERQRHLVRHSSSTVQAVRGVVPSTPDTESPTLFFRVTACLLYPG